MAAKHTYLSDNKQSRHRDKEYHAADKKHSGLLPRPVLSIASCRQQSKGEVNTEEYQHTQHEVSYGAYQCHKGTDNHYCYIPDVVHNWTNLHVNSLEVSVLHEKARCFTASGLNKNPCEKKHKITYQIL
jgi:hypothetical protein